MKAKKEKRVRPAGSQGPSAVIVLEYLASSYLRYGPHDRARALYELLVSLKPKNRRFRIALGYACLKSGRLAEALTHLEASFKGRLPLGWDALLLGRALLANGRVVESRELMRRCLGGEGKR